MKNNEKPDILSRIRSMKLRRELTVLLAFMVMLSTSYVMIHPGEALNNSTARSFMFFNEEEGMEETAALDINALLDADRDSGSEEETPAEVPADETVPEETVYAEPTQTPAEIVVPALEPTVTPENTASAKAEGTPASTAMASAESESTSDPFSTASAEPETTGTPETTASASPETTATDEPTLTPEPSPSATSETVDEVLYPAFSAEDIIPLEEDGTETEENIRVFIRAAEGTFPEGTNVKVVLVRDTKVLEAIEQAAVDKAKEENKDVKVSQVQAVDITFYDKDGNEIQPKDEQKVAVTFKSALIREAEDTTVVHVEQDENKENVTNTSVLDTVKDAADEELVEKIDSDEAVVIAESFSVYGIVGLNISTEFSLPGNNDTYVVTVTYDEEACIPNNSYLNVSVFEEGSEEYIRAKNALLANIKEEGKWVYLDELNVVALDISIIGPDGKEVEPLAPVTVEIDIKELPGAESVNSVLNTLQVQHHVETEDGLVVVENVFDGASEGTYEMGTDEQIIAANYAVDPNSVSENDFEVPGPKDEEVSDDEEEDNRNDGEVSAIIFETASFSTFTISWGGGGGQPTNTTTNLRFRGVNGFNGVTRARITVHYVDQDGNPITRPDDIGGNTDITGINGGANNTVNIRNTLGLNINGYTYEGAYTYKNNNRLDVTSVNITRTNNWFNNTQTVRFYNGNTQIWTSNAQYDNYNAGDIYLVYSGGGQTLGDHTTVHYGYMDGSTFVEFQDPPSPTDYTTNHHVYLIYDFDGYQYAGETYYRTTQAVNGANMKNGATEIQPRLQYTSSRWRYYTTGGTSTANQNVANNSHIYVVYEKENGTTKGGTPTVKPTSSVEPPIDPKILKESEPNGDGTNKLSLSILGHTADLELEKLADVIVVFDVSGSMQRQMGNNNNGTHYYNSQTGKWTGTSRRDNALQAVDDLASALFSKTNSDGEKLVRMSLVTFSTDADTEISLDDVSTSASNNYNAFHQALVDLGTPDGGTNWEKGLFLADQMTVDPGRATFVIFVTDGNPTFRLSRTNATNADLEGDLYNYGGNDQYYVSNHVFGQGNSDNDGRNYDAALVRALSIVQNGKRLYTVGISNNVDNLNDFADDAGASGKYSASSSDELVQAFNDIQASIEALMGFGDLKMTDGITDLSNTVEKSGLINVKGDFEYWKAPAPANWDTLTREQKESYQAPDSAFVRWDPASEYCDEAVYDEDAGSVIWDMGQYFVPEDGATYKVTFDVWPTQEAYDILAKCKNDPNYYDSLTDAQKAQIVRTGTNPNYTYTLKTNDKTPNTTYKSATKSGTDVQTYGDTQTIYFNEVDPMGLAEDQVGVQKTWNNKVDSTQPHDITLELYGEENGTKVLYKSFTLNADNNWTASDGFISCGLMSVNESTGEVVVYETGHDFTLVETGEGSYFWDLKAPTYRPMVINTVETNLTLVEKEEDIPAGMGDSDFYNDNGMKYYRIEGHVYKFHSDGSEGITLTASNDHRTYVDLSKVVTGVESSKEQFTFKVTLNDSMGEDNGNQGYLFFTVRDMAVGRNLDNTSVTTSATYYPVDGAPYFRVFTGEEFTLNIRQGWNVRFLNLPGESSYTIEEVDNDNYEFVGITATALIPRPGTGEDADIDISGDVTIDGKKIDGTVRQSNAGHNIVYENRALTREVNILKTTETGKTEPLAGAVFDLYTREAYESTPRGTAEKTGLISSSEEGKEGVIELGEIAVGDYYLVETAAPAGYNPLIDPVQLTVETNKITIIQGTSQRQDTTPDDEDYDAFIINTSGTELPMTGGTGTLPYTLGGITVMLTALMYGFRMRRRERRLN